MTLIIALWLVYVNAVVEPLTGNKTEPDNQKIGFFKALGTGLIVVSDALKLGGESFLGTAQSLLNKKQVFEVKRPKINFLIDDLERIPETSLP